MSTARIRSAVGRELHAIRERFEQADRQLLQAGTRGDAAGREQAQADRDAALGEHFAAARQLADLFLLLFRYALDYRRDELRVYLSEILSPEPREYLAERPKDRRRRKRRFRRDVEQALAELLAHKAWAVRALLFAGRVKE